MRQLLFLGLIVFGLIVVYFGYRGMRPGQLESGQQNTIEGIELNVGSESEQVYSKLGVKAEQATTMQSKDNADGFVAFTLSADKKQLSIAGSLPERKMGLYQVWIDRADGAYLLGTLRAEKGGYLLDATVPSWAGVGTKIQVTQEEKVDNTREKVIFEGELR